MYDYKKVIKTDVKEWMDNNEVDITDPNLESEIFESCWVCDYVTGNASGSYTFSRCEARDNFFNDPDSEDYVREMIDEGFISSGELGERIAQSDWEWLDVSIRCFLLDSAIGEVLAGI